MREQRRWRWAAVGVATALTVGGCAAGANAQGQQAGAALVTSPPGAAGNGAPDTVTVSGTGSVAGTPDKAVLSLTVHVGASTANGALVGANAAMARVQQALTGQHVAKADMQTSALSLQPNYSYDGSTPHLDGYVVDEGVTATIRALSSAGTTVDAVVRAGGNAVRIDGFSLDLDGGSTLVARARAAAFAEAKTKAEQYARLSGRSLGGVVSVQEGELTPVPVPMYAGADRAAMPAMAVPVQAGTQQVSVDVQVVWALG